MDTPRPTRAPWNQLPDVVLHAPIDTVKGHADYEAAKAGDAGAALRLVVDTLSDEALRALQGSAELDTPVLAPVHALENTGVNAIPLALAEEISRRIGWPIAKGVVQANLVGHTGASGFARLARQAVFVGAVEADRDYVLVDDFIGQGGTLANLRGHLLAHGGRVVGATVLTGKLHSARLALSPSTLDELRRKHGAELEEWWRERFDHGFDCLTESEARYLFRTPDADRVRDRVAAAEHAGDRGVD